MCWIVEVFYNNLIFFIILFSMYYFFDLKDEEIVLEKLNSLFEIIY